MLMQLEGSQTETSEATAAITESMPALKTEEAALDAEAAYLLAFERAWMSR